MNQPPLPVWLLARWHAVLLGTLLAVGGVAASPTHAAPGGSGEPREKLAIALLPTTGDAPRDQRTKLDAALRKAVVADGGYVVQAARDTAEQIGFMAEQGTICTSTDIPCLQKLGILADVQLLLVPEASGERELEVTITLLNAEDANILRTVNGEVNLATASAQKLVERALHGGDDPEDVVVDRPPPKDPLASDIDRPKTDEPVDETKLNDVQFAGVAVASVGGGLGALALLGALSCEAIFWTGTGTAETRKDVIAPLGSVLWIATTIAAVTAGIGGAVYFAGAPPDEADNSLSAVP